MNPDSGESVQDEMDIIQNIATVLNLGNKHH